MRVKIGDAFVNFGIALAIQINEDQQVLSVNYGRNKLDYELSNEEWEITVLPKLIKYLNEK